MPPLTPGLARLPVLRNAEDLLEFLRELNWPLPFDALAEDLTFDWTGEDLRLSEAANQRLAGGSVRQLRTMAEKQPWGIFLVEFAKPHVYRTALRNILRGLVPSRRRDSSLAAWQHPNLLFICATANYSQVTFAHFRGEKAGRARLATFGWEQGSRYARTLLEFNVPALAWPQRPSDTTGWLRQWSSAFDVEPVTKEFFRVYSDVFRRVEASVTGLAGDTEKRRMWTQRLFNRLMFIGFIEKKGWLRLGERTDYLAALWEAWQREPDKSGLSFYAARLKHLFFLALNNAGERNLIGINRGGLFAHLLGDVPYLNGGLFEQDADDKDASIGVPDEAFGTILNDLFARFNFTVTESTPLDVEVAVDPEMLGKVFEELVTGRHESGSYYTPKPIVAFMCREALKHYLAGVLAEDQTALTRFVDEHDPGGLRDGEQVLNALKRVRVCDPACGSGAYLLGMLHELVALRECLFATQKLDTPSSHTRKLEIIQHNLYGVDLDQFAVNIARLRLWLSLAVDYQGETPPPLPNLDFKIESGDSLSAPDPQIVFSGQGALRVEVARQFQEAKAAYLLAHGEEKKALRGKAEGLRTDLKTWLHSESPAGAFDWAVEFAEIFAPRPALAALDGGLNLGDSLAATEAGGFDIIVANPPYVRQELLKAQKPVLKARYECYDGTADLFVYFYERAAKILKNGGTLAFISSNKFYRAGYGKKLRGFLGQKTSIKTVVDFGDAPVFGAIAYASILIAVRTRPAPDASARVLTWAENTGGFEHLAEIVETKSQPLVQSELGDDGWRLESTGNLRLLEKIRQAGKPLREYIGGRTTRGITTGFNEAFVVDAVERQRLTTEHPSSVPVLKPFMRGKDIKRWSAANGGAFLIKIESSANVSHPWSGLDVGRAEHAFRNLLPAIQNRFAQFRSDLINRDDQGMFFWELRSCTYWEAFTQPKIVSTKISLRPTFALDTSGSFLGNTAYFLPARTDGPYVLALLNSRVFYAYAKKVFVEKQNGYYEVQPAGLDAFPIPAATPAEKATITALVDRVFAAKNVGDAATVRSLEAEIDTHVFHLYRLTPEEQALIPSDT